MINAAVALDRLREGNQRFVAAVRDHGRLPESPFRGPLPQVQRPWAIVLGCADSRVPPEMVFDQGPGDLFVVRVAGNVVGKAQLDSIEFAAEQFGSPLVVVLGHSRCGAVIGTLEQLSLPPEQRTTPRSFVTAIEPVVEEVVARGGATDKDALVDRVVRANIEATARMLSQSAVLAQRMHDLSLGIVGAEYRLETGEVEFL